MLILLYILVFLRLQIISFLPLLKQFLPGVCLKMHVIQIIIYFFTFIICVVIFFILKSGYIMHKMASLTLYKKLDNGGSLY